MIEILTGVPGSGKSLSNVVYLHNLMKRWLSVRAFDKARPVFVHNIPGLALPHSKMPTVAYQPNPKVEPIQVPDWDLMPDHSLVFIDECAEMFPPRSSASAMPSHVLFLTVHRKRGFDILFTTQNPKFVDHSLRALVGKHQHFRRLFGMNRSVVYEWDGCSDTLAFGTAVKSYFSFPKDIYKLYKSADVHTKQSFKLPKWLLIPVLGLVMGIYFIPAAVATLGAGMSGKGISKAAVSGKVEPVSRSVVSIPSVSGVVVSPVRFIGSIQGVSGVPDTPFTRPVVLAAACVASEKRCQCYNESGVKIKLPEFDCRKAAHEPVDFSELRS